MRTRYALLLAAVGALAAAGLAARTTGLLGRIPLPSSLLPARAELGKLHVPAMDEYHYHYRDKPELPLFSWLYAGFLIDDKGREYQFVFSYYAEESSYYPGCGFLLRRLDGEADRAASAVETVWKARRPRFLERGDSVRFESDSKSAGVRIDVDPRRHTLRVRQGTRFTLDLSFDRMEPAFFLNRGEPVVLNAGGALQLIDEFVEGTGELELDGERRAVRAQIAHERTYAPGDQWQCAYQDWLCVFHDDFYALLFLAGERGQKEAGALRGDGFVYFRKEREYVPLRTLRIEDLATEEVRILRRGRRVSMRAPLALRAEASGRRTRLGFEFRRAGRPYERELVLRGRGFVEHAGRRREYDSLRAWEEFMR